MTTKAPTPNSIISTSLNPPVTGRDVATQFSPDAATLQTFNLVIWATGAANPPLDELDRWQIESTLQEGGNIMLVGPRIGDDEANRDMLRNFFGARHESDSVRAYTVEGIAGNRPIPRNFQMPLPGGDARMSPSTMTPVMGADSLVNYHLGDILGVGGVYRYNRNTEAKTVYLGFAFEKGSDSRTPRSDYLARIYEWFMADPNATPFDEQGSRWRDSLPSNQPTRIHSTGWLTSSMRFQPGVSSDSISAIHRVASWGRSQAALGGGHLR